MKYISAQEAATKWGISKRRVQVLCTENRIEEATRIGNMWVVPEDAQKPADGRVQTRKIVDLPTTREARTALKKLTIASYEEINKYLNDPSTSKMVFISLLATAIFHDIDSDKITRGISDTYVRISQDLFSGKKNEIDRLDYFYLFTSLTIKFEKYISRYSEYVDDILSWAYQYVNKLSMDSGLESTQFFTEKYMIEYLTKTLLRGSQPGERILDPACGGGNFLSYILEQKYSLNEQVAGDHAARIKENLDSVCGYELDPNLAAVAAVNLKLKALMLLSKVRGVSIDDWQLFCPNIYTSVKENGFGFLETNFAEHKVCRIIDGKQDTLEGIVKNASAIYTNPPFQTIKGMEPKLKDHLKRHFPEAKCDMCNAFILQCIDNIQLKGKIGLVTQSSWMYLDSFEQLRHKVIQNNTIESIADLGSGAFYDLSGEKANVALVLFSKGVIPSAGVRVLTLRDLPIKEKAAALNASKSLELLLDQKQLFSGEHSAFTQDRTQREEKGVLGKYGEFGVPMQGTSTGNASQLISYYWEHLDDPDWIPVSKGGGYSRWCGLNNYVLKWGKDGEYIRATKGSALRNTKYFPKTSLVYSDTGTSGFNVRMLENGQVFVASGPGIRDIDGNPYAHLALLNSRIFSYYLRSLSPKLTVAAGYIARVSVPESLFNSPEMAMLGKTCYDKKHEFLRVRPTNLEWSALQIQGDTLDAYIEWLFMKEIQDELIKLTKEEEIDRIVLAAYALDEEEIEAIDSAVGLPATRIEGVSTIEKLDKAIAEALDVNCQLIRTRVNKQTLGCDGVLEYVARKESVSPKTIVRMIREAPERFVKCKERYRSLILHGLVLAALGFRKEKETCMELPKLRHVFSKMYPMLCSDWGMIEAWINERFNLIHGQSFYSKPYYCFENGCFRIMKEDHKG